MQQYLQKWTLVHFLEQVTEGKAFAREDWTHHISLADTFAIDINTGELIGLISNELKGVSSPTTQVTGFKTFGADKVAILQNSENLQDLHNKIINLLKNNGAVFNNPEFTRIGFIPHITLHGRRIDESTKYNVDTASLVDMFPNSNPQRRKVIKTIKF
jgi:2'-5' RNA ligase